MGLLGIYCPSCLRTLSCVVPTLSTPLMCRVTQSFAMISVFSPLREEADDNWLSWTAEARIIRLHVTFGLVWIRALVAGLKGKYPVSLDIKETRSSTEIFF